MLPWHVDTSGTPTSILTPDCFLPFSAWAAHTFSRGAFWPRPCHHQHTRGGEAAGPRSSSKELWKDRPAPGSACLSFLTANDKAVLPVSHQVDLGTQAATTSSDPVSHHNTGGKHLLFQGLDPSPQGGTRTSRAPESGLPGRELQWTFRRYLLNEFPSVNKTHGTFWQCK